MAMNLSAMSCETFCESLGPCLASVRKFVFTRFGGGDQVEDILQQTLLQAFTHRDQLRAHTKFKSWLCSIAVNEIWMFRRRARRYLPLQGSLAMQRDEALSPLEWVEQLERVSRVRTAMAMLSERDRKAIHLRDLECCAMAQTAEALRSSEPAAKSVHFRARRLEVVLRTYGAARTASDWARSVLGDRGLGEAQNTSPWVCAPPGRLTIMAEG
jgi:RNA polymerase sigma-70 factor (ECF subfamily)